jgi:hypothetical protein
MWLYVEDLQQWLKVFSWQHNKLTKEPAKAQMGLCEFLGSDLPGVQGNYKNYNTRVKYPLCKVQNWLEKVFALRNKKLYDLLQSVPGFSVGPFPS